MSVVKAPHKKVGALEPFPRLKSAERNIPTCVGHLLFHQRTSQMLMNLICRATFKGAFLMNEGFNRSRTLKLYRRRFTNQSTHRQRYQVPKMFMFLRRKTSSKFGTIWWFTINEWNVAKTFEKKLLASSNSTMSSITCDAASLKLHSLSPTVFVHTWKFIAQNN